MSRVYTEFYCRASGGGCGGYIILPLTSEGDFAVKFKCPKCGHEHERGMIGGVIVDRPSKKKDAPRTIELLPTMAAWSAEPRTRAMRVNKRRRPHTEAAAVAKRPRDFIMAEAWVEHFGGVA